MLTALSLLRNFWHLTFLISGAFGVRSGRWTIKRLSYPHLSLPAPQCPWIHAVVPCQPLHALLRIFSHSCLDCGDRSLCPNTLLLSAPQPWHQVPTIIQELFHQVPTIIQELFHLENKTPIEAQCLALCLDCCMENIGFVYPAFL